MQKSIITAHEKRPIGQHGIQMHV